MSLLKSLADEFSAITGLPLVNQNEVCSFEIGKQTSLVLEAQGDKSFFISVCFRCEDERKRKDILVRTLKLLHPLRSGLFFCKMFLLESCIVIATDEKVSQLSVGKLYQFQSYAIKTLMKAGAGEL